MITHKAFTEHLGRVLTKATLAKQEGWLRQARETLESAINEIEIHTRNTVTKTPALLRIERDIFRMAYQLQARAA